MITRLRTNFGQTHHVSPRSVAFDDLRMPLLENPLVVKVELDERAIRTALTFDAPDVPYFESR